MSLKDIVHAVPELHKEGRAPGNSLPYMLEIPDAFPISGLEFTPSPDDPVRGRDQDISIRGSLRSKI